MKFSGICSTPHIEPFLTAFLPSSTVANLYWLTVYGSKFSKNWRLNIWLSLLTTANGILNGSAPIHIQNRITWIAGKANWKSKTLNWEKKMNR